MNSARPLRLLLFSNTREKMGGADRDWINLANALGPDKIDLTWVGAENTDCLEPLLDPALKAKLVDVPMPFWGFLTHENMLERRSLWLWFKILARHRLNLKEPLAQAQAKFASTDYDLVVTNSSVVHLGAVYAKSVGLPHVWCVKEWFDPKIRGCRRFARYIESRSVAVTVPSKAMSPAFKNPQVCYDGSDTATIRANVRRTRAEILEELNLPADRLVLAQAAGLYWWKGQHVTARALVELAKHRPQPVSMLFLGGGAAEYTAEVKAILNGLPQAWQEGIRYVRYAPDDYSYLAAADAVIHPSVLPDPWPNAVREALILGRPVLASNAGGIMEMINDGVNGLLAEPENVGEFTAGLEKLFGSESWRTRLGQEAGTLAPDQFDINRLSGAFWDVFQKAARREVRT